MAYEPPPPTTVPSQRVITNQLHRSSSEVKENVIRVESEISIESAVDLWTILIRTRPEWRFVWFRRVQTFSNTYDCNSWVNNVSAVEQGNTRQQVPPSQVKIRKIVNSEIIISCDDIVVLSKNSKKQRKHYLKANTVFISVNSA